MHLQQKDSRVYVAGHGGLVGSAVVRALRRAGYNDLIGRTRRQLDLRDQAAVHAFFEAERPDFVVLAAARVGGILANNSYPADFLYDNLVIQTNVIQAAHETGVKRFIFLGSSCIYPRLAPQPMPEDALLTGPLEPTNQWYAIAKIAGLMQCEAYHRQYGDDFFSVMPTNLYGPGDNFDLETSHVLPALIRKFHEARTTGGPVTIWGTGRPRREFLFSDDLGEALLFLLEHPEDRLRAAAPDGILNIGMGRDLTITELAETIRDVVGADCEIVYDRSKPDGTPRKLMDVERMTRLGWQAHIPLREGLDRTYQWFLEHEADTADEERNDRPASAPGERLVGS